MSDVKEDDTVVVDTRIRHSGDYKPRYYKRPVGRYETTAEKTTLRETQDQDDELLALASIYDADVFSASTDTYSGRYFAHVVLPVPFHVVINEATTSKRDIGFGDFQVLYLPPIVLSFRLPPKYPSTDKPFFRLSCSWLNKTQLTNLCQLLDDIWEENKGTVILYQWTEALVECLPRLDIHNSLDLSWTLQNRKENSNKSTPEKSEGRGKPVIAPAGRNNLKPTKWRIREPGDPRALPDSGDLATILPTIIEYNQTKSDKRFQTETFVCKVCFESKLGAQCLQFTGCDHVYCKECMKSYFEIQIREGNVAYLNCPEDKCKSQATPAQVRQLVGSELYAKYDQMLLECTLNSMSDIAYCPRISCNSPVLIETENSMGTCPVCFFVFCIYCRMTSHGVEPCRVKSKEFRQLYEAYTNGTAQEKSLLEARYGKTQLRRIIESTLSETWLESNSKPCPNCYALIEKIDGCNKMMCWKCNRPFCWLCMAKLDPVHPYSHFDDTKNECYGRLFPFDAALEEEDDDDDEIDHHFGFLL